MNPAQQQLPDLKTTAGVKCIKCDGQIFTEGIILRKASKFLTGTAQDSLMPLPIFHCVNCNTPIHGMIPLVIRSEYELKNVEEPDKDEKKWRDYNGEPTIENIKRLNHEQ